MNRWCPLIYSISHQSRANLQRLGLHIVHTYNLCRSGILHGSEWRMGVCAWGEAVGIYISAPIDRGYWQRSLLIRSQGSIKKTPGSPGDCWWKITLRGFNIPWPTCREGRETLCKHSCVCRELLYWPLILRLMGKSFSTESMSYDVTHKDFYWVLVFSV